ncbi:MAG: MFS transporter [Rhizobiales bacterium]|nr:MFS transporter [Hyphomicrobiales bacterium]
MSQQVSDSAIGVAPVKSTPFYRHYALFLLVLAYTSSHVDRNIMGIVLQPIQTELGASDTAMGFLGGLAFALFYATLGIPIALWADRGNRRNIIALAIAVWSAMTALCGLAQNFTQLAIARVGVGVGEAGSSPPSHSIISDLYPRKQRSTAMAIYALGVYFGVMIGFVVGGYVAQDYGWRATFFVVGLPGILIALLVRFTLREPARGAADGIAQDMSHRSSVKDVFHHLWTTRAARHVVIGVTLVSFIGYGGLVWGPAFLFRSHGLTPKEAGLFLGPVAGLVGGCGALFGGYLSDRLGRNDMRWNAWVIAVSKIVAVPLFIAYYTTDNITVLFAAYVGSTVLGAFYLGPSFAMIQSLTPIHMRATASAVMLFVLNIIGLGLGPQIVGFVSEMLKPAFGVESLRYALFGTAFLGIWAAWHYYLAGRSYEADLAKLGGKDLA